MYDCHYKHVYIMHGLVAIFLSATNMPVPLVSCFTFRAFSHLRSMEGCVCMCFIDFMRRKLKYSITYPGKSFRLRDTIPQTNTKCILENGCLEDFHPFLFGANGLFSKAMFVGFTECDSQPLPTFWPIKAPLYHCTARKPWSIIVEALRGVEWGGRWPIKNFL